jgi:hypothetical protein
MNKKHLVVLLALAFGLAWFLPVIKDGVTFPKGLPGWEAFRVAASPVWPIDDSAGSSDDPWYWNVLSVLSAATNAVMLFSLAVLVLNRSSLTRVMAWSAGLAFCINAQWCVRMGIDHLSDLRIGYFLWWASFLALFVLLLSVRTSQIAARRAA